MRLESLLIKNLHGALNIDIKFQSDVNLLVGINGSGKTSVFNCIDLLLRPDLRRLAILEYKYLELQFQFKGELYTLVAEKSSKQVQLYIKQKLNIFAPLVINLRPNINPEDDEATAYYNQLGPEKHERPIWNFLKSLPRPVVITLDRTISAETDDSYYFEDNRSYTSRRPRLKSPLTYVQEVTSSAFAAYREISIAADDELKAEIVMSALQRPDFLEPGPSKRLTPNELKRLEDKVVQYISKTVKTDNVKGQVKEFFQETSAISHLGNRVALQQNFLLNFIDSRYRQIDNLAKAFNKYEKKNANAFKKLSSYLETVNGFFKDSKKELFFEESTGKLVFSFVKNGERDTSRREISNLSSGERQILILFTFLAFDSSSSTVFIVDEPELSLHPKWQHEFMDGFLKLKPEKAQVLLATHSPEIVGKHKHACLPLKSMEFPNA